MLQVFPSHVRLTFSYSITSNVDHFSDNIRGSIWAAFNTGLMNWKIKDYCCALLLFAKSLAESLIRCSDSNIHNAGNGAQCVEHLTVSFSISCCSCSPTKCSGHIGRNEILGRSTTGGRTTGFSPKGRTNLMSWFFFFGRNARFNCRRLQRRDLSCPLSRSRHAARIG